MCIKMVHVLMIPTMAQQITTVSNAVMQSYYGAGQTGFVLRDDSGETLASTVIQLDEEQITCT